METGSHTQTPETFCNPSCTIVVVHLEGADGRPYVVPMNYAFDGTHPFFTTEGMKTQFTSRTEMYFRAANGIKPQS